MTCGLAGPLPGAIPNFFFFFEMQIGAHPRSTEINLNLQAHQNVRVTVLANSKLSPNS